MARQTSLEIHKMTHPELPKIELYEEGSQIRRSSKSTCSNIVEGYGRKKYQPEYYRFLTFALASNDETINHLEMLFETASLKNKDLFDEIHSHLITLGKKLNNLLQTIDAGIKKDKFKITGSTTGSQKPETSS